MIRLTNYLFARPSFWEGIARIFDFSNTLNEYNYCRTPEEADYYAIFIDWRTVGDDIITAISSWKARPEVKQRLQACGQEKTAITQSSTITQNRAKSTGS